ncbi:MAG: hypothetical protein H6706_26285 [Myxococcales bacterium]|nr:hypothetical protein [Myxococcales bacterium]
MPRAVVLSGDSLVRDARTPLHTAVEYADLAGRVDWVWLLVTWDGIEPRPGTYNGAYLGRICEQAALAEAAGIGVVLAMHQERMGPAFGGHGFPAWVTGAGPAVPPDQPDHPAIAAAWDAFWGDPERPAALARAWGRLLDTCADRTGIVGVHPLVDARGPAGDVDALLAQVAEAAATRWGPVLTFHDGPTTLAGPDVVRTASGFGPGRGPEAPLGALAAWLAGEAEAARRAGEPLFVRGAGAPGDGLDEALARVEGVGAAGAVWHDGFGRDAYALRDEDGRPTDRWPVAFERTWPLAVAGPVRAFGPTADGWRLRWHADGRAAGLSRVQVGPLGADPEATLEPGDLSWFTGYDVVTGELSVFVQGDAGEVELTIRARGE